MKDGIINIDTEFAKQLSFTSDKFNPASYLWKQGNTIIISVIIANKKGMFCQLINTILQNGFDFEIPTPSERMCEIGKKQKWNFCEKEDELFGRIDIITNKEKKGRQGNKRGNDYGG
jgi:hypothetical protein